MRMTLMSPASTAAKARGAGRRVGLDPSSTPRPRYGRPTCRPPGPANSAGPTRVPAPPRSPPRTYPVGSPLHHGGRFPFAEAGGLPRKRPTLLSYRRYQGHHPQAKSRRILGA